MVQFQKSSLQFSVNDSILIVPFPFFSVFSHQTFHAWISCRVYVTHTLTWNLSSLFSVIRQFIPGFPTEFMLHTHQHRELNISFLLCFQSSDSSCLDFLQSLCYTDINIEKNTTVETGMLNYHGGYEATCYVRRNSGNQYVPIFPHSLSPPRPLADLHTKISGTPPPTRPISFILTYVFAEKHPLRRSSPTRVGVPHRKILDPPLPSDVMVTKQLSQMHLVILVIFYVFTAM